MVGAQRTLDADLFRLAVAPEAPAPFALGKGKGQAGMGGQVGGGLRRALPGKVGRAGADDPAARAARSGGSRF